jgi:hypothetical protein
MTTTSFRSLRKHLINPAMMRLAGAPWSPISPIRHVGRRSGKRYANPIIAEPTNDGFIFALTYGPNVDWYRNCLATGHCSLLWHGKAYDLDEVRDIDPAGALRAFPLPERLMLRVLGTDHFVHMTRRAA